ncbi:CocE/NonD family hydrolase [Cohnella abietis]|uniref:Acyl esterase n=1 Tax=Cohnella abietis TaxID=2507935 RepID=A0A3T1D0X6_9BACL|nr:CocE/NonD family hydrolase [Cohnella abietis]BBI31708.1 acyl esterase [Cohnella abietis]
MSRETSVGPMPEPGYSHGEYKKEFVEMSDGIRLVTHVWLPSGKGPWPTILVRNPYVDGEDVRDPSLLQFVEHGYAIVLQECRGRGRSEGVWHPYINERQDGLDTLQWLIVQQWQNGNIGLYGGSYLSFNQWILADVLPKEVKTMYISVMGTDVNRFAYMNGMFRHDIYTSWLLSNSGVDWAGRDLNEVARQAYRIRPPMQMDRQLMGVEASWYRNILANPGSGDDLWNDAEPWCLMKQLPSQVNIPICMVGGWFDIALDTMFEAYFGLRQEIRAISRFVVGPWVHSLAPYGDLDYPGGWVDGPNGGTKAVLEWFNYTLKGQSYTEALGVVHAYEIGENKWKTWGQWPPSKETLTFHLNDHLSLGLKPVEQDSKLSYLYDPDHPVETVGGSGLLSVYGDSEYLPKAASVKQHEPCYREDVISFLSEPLEQDMPIAGQIKAVLHVSSSAEDTAFTVKLIEVFPNGVAYNIADGITSLAYRNGAEKEMVYSPQQRERLTIELWAISWRMKQGSRIRLDVSSSNSPAYHAHPNLPGNWAKQKDVIIANQTLYWGGEFDSHIEFPIYTI